MIKKMFANNPLFLAPMAGVTDFAFRSIAKDCGADFTCTEMVSAKGLLYDSQKTSKMLFCMDNEKPKIVQIFGNEPEVYSQVVKKYLNDFDIIDMNFGCPAPKIFCNNQGSALLDKPALVYSLANAVRKSCDKIVSAKIRLGIQKDNFVGAEIARVLEDAGVNFLTVHGRTKQDGYSGNVNLEQIAKIKACVKIPVVGNGDVKDLKSYLAMRQTGVDGVMIGRGALGNPEIFAKIKNIPYPSKFEIVKKHIELLRTMYPDQFLTKYMRKHLLWYLKGTKNNQVKLQICTMENVDEILDILKKCLTES